MCLMVILYPPEENENSVRNLGLINYSSFLVATHRFTAEEGDWGFTRFYDLRSLFSEAWENKGVPLVQDDEANVTAYVRVVKDPTGVLWHNFQK